MILYTKYLVTPTSTHDVVTVHYQPRVIETDDLPAALRALAETLADERHHTAATFTFEVRKLRKI